MAKVQYTNEELYSFEKLRNDLILCLFYRPDEDESILRIIKEAYNLGKELGQKRKEEKCKTKN